MLRVIISFFIAVSLLLTTQSESTAMEGKIAESRHAFTLNNEANVNDLIAYISKNKDQIKSDLFIYCTGDLKAPILENLLNEIEQRKLRFQLLVSNYSLLKDIKSHLGTDLLTALTLSKLQIPEEDDPLEINLNGLKNLEVVDCNITGTLSISLPRAIAKIVDTQFSKNGQITFVRSIKEIDLSLNNCVGDKGIFNHISLEKVLNLSISKNTLSSSDLDLLKKVGSNSLSVTDSVFEHKSSLAEFMQNVKVNTLTIINSKIDSDDLNSLKSVQVKFLVLSDNAIGDKSLDFISASTALQYVVLDRTLVTNVGLSKIAKNANLIQISVEGCKGVDDGIIGCKFGANLTGINLGNTSVGESGISYLLENYTLQKIGITNLSLPNDYISERQKKYPKVRFIIKN